MTSSVPDETRNLHEELLVQLRDLVSSAFLNRELDCDGELGLAGEAKPAFSFSWPGIKQARRHARIPTTATLIPDEDASHTGRTLVMS